MQVEVDVKCMQTNFGGHGLSSFGDFAPFHLPSKTAKFPFQFMDYKSMGVRKWNWLKKFTQVEVDSLPLSLSPSFSFLP